MTTGWQTLWVGVHHCKLYSARIYDVSRQLVATTNCWVHTRHAHLTAPWLCWKKLHGVWTTTVEVQCRSSRSVSRQLGIPLYAKAAAIWNVPVYSNGEFTPASLPRHPRRGVTYFTHILMLVGKVYWNVCLLLWWNTYFKSSWIFKVTVGCALCWNVVEGDYAQEP